MQLVGRHLFSIPGLALAFGVWIAMAGAGLAQEPPKWCRYAKSDAEKAICVTASLWDLDRCQEAAFQAVRSKATARERPALDKEEKDWTQARDRCGTNAQCIEHSYRERIKLQAKGDIAECRPPPAAQAAIAAGATASCHVAAGAQAKVALRSRDATVRVGEKVDLDWEITAPGHATCTTALYLMIATAPHFRFQGHDFFALAPKAPGPFRLAYRADSLRALIPLERTRARQQGTLSLFPLLAGTQAVSWSLVELAADEAAARPPGRAPLAIVDGPAIALRTRPGVPRLVVQDRYDIGQPKRQVYSLDGRFHLRDYEGFFEVVTSDTKDVVLRDEGWFPSFSPTSRFLASYSGTSAELAARLQIYDLLAGTRVHSSTAANTPDAALAWAHQDSFAIVDKGEWGSFDLVQPLINERVLDGIAYYSGRFVPALATAAMRLSLENTSIVVTNEHEADRHVSLLVDQKEYERRSGQNDDYEHNQKAVVAYSQKLVAQLGRLSHPSLAAARDNTPDDPLLDIRQRWLVGDDLRLSHLLDEEHRKSTLATLLVTHSAKPVAVASAEGAGGPTVGVAMSGRVRGEGSQPPAGEPVDATAVASTTMTADDEWAKLGLRLTEMDGGRVLAPPLLLGQTKLDSPWRNNNLFNTVINQPLRRSAPELSAAVDDLLTRNTQARATIRRFEDDENPCFGYPQEPDPSKADHLVAETISQLWQWQWQGETIWLAHALCYAGATGSGPPEGRLMLYRSGPRQQSALNLGALLPPEFFLVPASFQDPRPLAAWIGNGHLVMASRTSDSAAVLNLRSSVLTALPNVLTRARNLRDLRLDQDNKLLVQRNKEVESFLVSLPQRKMILQALEIDGEAIVMAADGTFQGSEESAHYAFLNFPGVPGLSSLHQFRRSLHDPRRIAAIVAEHAGAAARAPPATLGVAPPPALSVTWRQAARAQHAATASVRAASEAGLKSLRVFADGALRRTIPLQGKEVELSVDLGDRLGTDTDWVAFSVEDATGNESVARVLRLSRPSATRNAMLEVIAVGTDSYQDPGLGPLSLAVHDARNITAAMKRLEGISYRRVDSTLLVNETALRDKLLAALAAARTRLKAGDTLLLHVAAHGLRDDRGVYYFAGPATRLDDLKSTAVSWSDIASAIQGTEARVVVLLDSCHSGAAGTGEVNDGAASTLTAGKAPVLILAASKGRQLSNEDGSAGGGLFTATLVRLLAQRQRLDVNGSGRIELSEIYLPLKRRVSQLTKGQQTPWIARSSMVGEVPLF